MSDANTKHEIRAAFYDEVTRRQVAAQTEIGAASAEAVKQVMRSGRALHELAELDHVTAEVQRRAGEAGTPSACGLPPWAAEVLGWPCDCTSDFDLTFNVKADRVGPDAG